MQKARLLQLLLSKPNPPGQWDFPVTAELVLEPKGQARKESSQGIAKERQNTMRTESRESISKQPSSRRERSRRAQVGEIIGKEIARNLKTESLELREVHRECGAEGLF